MYLWICSGGKILIFVPTFARRASSCAYAQGNQPTLCLPAVCGAVCRYVKAVFRNNFISCLERTILGQSWTLWGDRNMFQFTKEETHTYSHDGEPRFSCVSALCLRRENGYAARSLHKRVSIPCCPIERALCAEVRKRTSTLLFGPLD